MKVGIRLKIDVSKLDKTRFFKGDKGVYADLTAFVELDEEDQYGNNGFITQAQTKEEREAKVQLPIIGNSKVFWKGESQQQRQQGYDNGIVEANKTLNAGANKADPFDDGMDVPF